MEDNSRYVTLKGNPDWIFDTQQDTNRLRIVSSGRAEPYKTSTRSTHAGSQSGTSRTEQTGQQQHSQATAPTGDENIDDLGRVSDDWKNAAGSLFIGSLIFVCAGVLMLSFTIYTAEILLYGIAALSLLYGIMRLSFSYFVYKDAKAIQYHSQERASKPWAPPGYGWKPKAFWWGVFTFIMPPFIEYAPATIYFYRRHSKTGVP